MTDLDTFISEARQRQARRETEEAAARAAEERRQRQALIDQLSRNLARALPADLIAALDLTYHTQAVEPQSYVTFTYGRSAFRLSYGEERSGARAREWRLTCGENERTMQRADIPETSDPLFLADRLLLAIGEMAQLDIV